MRQRSRSRGDQRPAPPHPGAARPARRLLEGEPRHLEALKGELEVVGLLLVALAALLALLIVRVPLAAVAAVVALATALAAARAARAAALATRATRRSGRVDTDRRLLWNFAAKGVVGRLRLTQQCLAVFHVRWCALDRLLAVRLDPEERKRGESVTAARGGGRGRRRYARRCSRTWAKSSMAASRSPAASASRPCCDSASAMAGGRVVFALE